MAEPDGATEELSYSVALTELDAILAELDADDIDVDALADKVARASHLIELCRARITAAGLQVTEVVSSLEPSLADPDDTAVTTHQAGDDTPDG